MSTYTDLYKKPPVPLPHEHSFIITTEHWEYAQRTVTLRFCSTCGLTHALHYNKARGFLWQHVEEWQPEEDNEK